MRLGECLIPLCCSSLQVVVVTDYAEGELFQILEDDGSLPEDQVTLTAVATQCLLQGGENRICLPAGSSLCCGPGDIRRVRAPLRLYLAELLKGVEREPGCIAGQFPCSLSKENNTRFAASAISLLRGTAGPRLELVPAGQGRSEGTGGARP